MTEPEKRKPWPWPLEFPGNALGVVILCVVVAVEVIARLDETASPGG